MTAGKSKVKSSYLMPDAHVGYGLPIGGVSVPVLHAFLPFSPVGCKYN